ncbi:vacuolar protein sorting-associated protein 8 homolog [Momordica charantia]|uniref:Vacuolar protein sorting-associated protein 8 homolog n=1 Tax=Momordica charantia TaxID=3673 RepID=A0A6J1CRK3_MOMCH|nr:vacuolar protein sorting-associated protein 8 homolog [Momordica charantia]
MTKELTDTGVLPLMELDLNAFIHAHLSSGDDDDDDDPSFPHRTIDEILKESGSPPSSPPHSPPYGGDRAVATRDGNSTVMDDTDADYQVASINVGDGVWARDRIRDDVPDNDEFRITKGLKCVAEQRSVDDVNFDESTTILPPVEANDGSVSDYAEKNVCSTELRPSILDVDESNEGAIPSSSEPDNDGSAVDYGSLEWETQDFKKCLQQSKDTEVDLVIKDPSVVNDISELGETTEHMDDSTISEQAEMMLLPSTNPLEAAEEIEKKQAFTALHWEEGVAAQPMKLEGIKGGSTTLGYFDIQADNSISRTISSHSFKREHGFPQVLAVHANYIAVGMSKGNIVVVASKYSAQNGDNMDAKMLLLGLQGDKSTAPVTSLCFNLQGDLLLAGYNDGHITVWDVLRASAAKIISGEHTSPVVHSLFLGQDAQVTRQFKAVTGDSKGLVLLHTFSVVPLLNRFSIKTQCLLDGQKTGTVLSASALLLNESCGSSLPPTLANVAVSTSSIGSMMGGVVGGDSGWKLFNEGSSLVEEGVVIFATHQTALVVRLSPTLEVYAQLSKPDGVREGSMPYTAWKCSQSFETSPSEAVERVSLLAIAWDKMVQVAKLVKAELKVCGKWSLESAAIGVAWLDDQVLVVLTITGQLFLFEKDGTMIHQTSVFVDGFDKEDFIAYHTHFVNVLGNPEKAYHNCVAVRGASVYVLGPMHLIISRLLPWKERVQVLRKAGDWMGALSMAITIYDGQAHGVIDLPRSLESLQELVVPFLIELLLSYVDEVFSYISVAFCNQIEKNEKSVDVTSGGHSAHSEIKEQYNRVGGVAVEFCVHIRRTDILFDEIFSKFVAVQQRDTFLELLEPYILKDMLGSLPPEIMQALVEHYSHKGWLQRVEQCVLHMDISSLDFNQVVRLCRDHGLYSALVYLFNKGLDDFRTPLEELLAVLQTSKSERASAIGYKTLVYLKYCFSGLAFPPGQGTLAHSRVQSLRDELLQFLLENSDSVDTRSISNKSSEIGYLKLYHLLELDTGATLDVLRCAFVEGEIPKTNSSPNGLDDVSMQVQEEKNSTSGRKNVLIQSIVDALVHVLDQAICQTDRSAGGEDIALVGDWPSKKDLVHLFDFVANYVACGGATASKVIVGQILEHLISNSDIPETENDFLPKVTANSVHSRKREKQVLSLLEVVPETHWNASSVLSMCEEAQFFQVCGLIHSIRHQYASALDSYMKDIDEPIHGFAFINRTLLELNNYERTEFQAVVISRIPELFNLNREGTFFLVIDHFNNDASDILSQLRTHPRSLFLYLKTLIEVHLSGSLNFSCLRKDDIFGLNYSTKGLDDYLRKLSDFPKYLSNNPVDVTDDIIELYVELLCQYERESVLKFLETFDSYRVEHCLRLCQQYEVIDAAAFLLERVGDVGSALFLTLSSLDKKFNDLEAAVESIVANGASSGSNDPRHFNSVLKLQEVNDIDVLLHACIGLCQRNTPRLNSEESETLWFKLLDSFCEPLIDSYNYRTPAFGENQVQFLNESSGLQKDKEARIVTWRILKSDKAAHILKRLFSRFIKEIVEGMIGYVHLPIIMSRLLSDNGSQEFGDFKLTVLGMLGTFGFERRILDTAKALIEDDTFYTMSLLKKGASHGYAPRNLVCCICNCLLIKSSSSYRVRVFNCGHATHLQCEVLDNEASGGDFSCPVCIHSNQSQRPRGKALTEYSLVNTFSSGTQSLSGASVQYPQETDLLELPYTLQQIPRFEILTNLQKNQRVIEIENVPQLRLAPPAVYHDKVTKGYHLLVGESSSGIEKQNKSKQLREVKVKRPSSLRFPLKASLFGKERTTKS